MCINIIKHNIVKCVNGSWVFFLESSTLLLGYVKRAGMLINFFFQPINFTDFNN